MSSAFLCREKSSKAKSVRGLENGVVLRGAMADEIGHNFLLNTMLLTIIYTTENKYLTV